MIMLWMVGEQWILYCSPLHACRCKRYSRFWANRAITKVRKTWHLTMWQNAC